jgi:hypothetical protein
MRALETGVVVAMILKSGFTNKLVLQESLTTFSPPNLKERQTVQSSQAAPVSSSVILIGIGNLAFKIGSTPLPSMH